MFCKIRKQTVNMWNPRSDSGISASSKSKSDARLDNEITTTDRTDRWFILIYGRMYSGWQRVAETGDQWYRQSKESQRIQRNIFLNRLHPLFKNESIGLFFVILTAANEKKSRIKTSFVLVLYLKHFGSMTLSRKPYVYQRKGLAFKTRNGERGMERFWGTISRNNFGERFWEMTLGNDFGERFSFFILDIFAFLDAWIPKCTS